MPKKLINFEGTSLIGYAGDGHEIHYIGSSAKSSWSLKTGERSTPPYGKFDGSCDYGTTCWDGSVECDENDCPELPMVDIMYNTDNHLRQYNSNLI